ncbi:MAG: DUF2239 family protein [Comamonadaceae bacterium]|nr:DUF2239 family protein [Comamonadaceae bacterium]
MAREVTLLLRHWEWLASQPGGASVALPQAGGGGAALLRGQDHIRQASAVAYQFICRPSMTTSGFREASRALFARTRPGSRRSLPRLARGCAEPRKKALATDAFWALNTTR